MPLEVVEVLGPVPSVRRHPSIELAERARVQPIEPALRIDLRGDEAGVAKHTKVLRHRRLRQAELRDEISDRTTLYAQEIQDSPAAWLGHDLERGKHIQYMPHTAYACQGIC